MLAYSLAMRYLGKVSLSEWAFHKLKTVGEMCRAMLDETFRGTIMWVLDQIGVDGGNKDTKAVGTPSIGIDTGVTVCVLR